jgi:hypothetical protein
MSKRLGEMKRAMDLSMDFVNGVDIQNGILSDKGQAMLEAFNRGEINLVDVNAADTIPRISNTGKAKDDGYRGLLE